MEYRDWVTQMKKDKPELDEFIAKLELFISDTGFNTSKFENAIELGLSKIENELNNSFNKKDDA